MVAEIAEALSASSSDLPIASVEAVKTGSAVRCHSIRRSSAVPLHMRVVGGRH